MVKDKTVQLGRTMCFQGEKVRGAQLSGIEIGE
jgi:hypothetical protein